MSVNGQGLYDLEPTEQELAELAEVMAEIEAEDDDYGPWKIRRTCRTSTTTAGPSQR